MNVETTLIRKFDTCTAYRVAFPRTVPGRERKPLSLEFTVSSSGTLHFDNRQPGAQSCADPEISRLLAAEMLRAARAQVPGALAGRTETGLAFELRIHYRFWRRGVLRSRTAVSDMGGLDRAAPDYDNNAVIFERTARKGRRRAEK